MLDINVIMITWHHIVYLMYNNNEDYNIMYSLADPGGAAGTRAPKGPDSFVSFSFIRFFPLRGCTPPTGNFGSATGIGHKLTVHVCCLSCLRSPLHQLQGYETRFIWSITQTRLVLTWTKLIILMPVLS